MLGNSTSNIIDDYSAIVAGALGSATAYILDVMSAVLSVDVEKAKVSAVWAVVVIGECHAREEGSILRLIVLSILVSLLCGLLLRLWW